MHAVEREEGRRHAMHAVDRSGVVHEWKGEDEREMGEERGVVAWGRGGNSGMVERRGCAQLRCEREL